MSLVMAYLKKYNCNAEVRKKIFGRGVAFRFLQSVSEMLSSLENLCCEVCHKDHKLNLLL